jgi:hypothetical protein
MEFEGGHTFVYHATDISEAILRLQAGEICKQKF